MIIWICAWSVVFIFIHSVFDQMHCILMESFTAEPVYSYIDFNRFSPIVESKLIHFVIIFSLIELFYKRELLQQTKIIISLESIVGELRCSEIVAEIMQLVVKVLCYGTFQNYTSLDAYHILILAEKQLTIPELLLKNSAM